MDKELKKLSRLELLELLLAQQEEFEALNKDNADKNIKIKALNKEILELKKELSLKPQIDEKMIEERYRVIYSQKMDEVQRLKDNAVKMSDALIAQTKEKCRKLIAQTKSECKEMLESANRDVEKAKREEMKIAETPSFLALARMILSDTEKYKDLLKNNNEQ